MPRQSVQLVNGEVYHICYRAVGDSLVFKNQDDYYRGIFSLYELNDSNPKEIWLRRKQRKAEKKLLTLGTPSSHQIEVVPQRNIFVDILTFCFMPNHLHLLLKQVTENGISKFVQKIGAGYASYFNKKHERKGHLFNQFKAIHIGSDNQLRNVVTYIHCNPISLIQPNWKEQGIKNPEKVYDFLENEYRWSSFMDYSGKSNFPSVTHREPLLELIGDIESIKQGVKDWILYKSRLQKAIEQNKAIFLE